MINREKWEATRAKRTSLQNELHDAEKSLQQMTYVAEQGPRVIDDLEQQFEKVTQLSSKDISLLFVSTGLQIAKWAIISSIRPMSLDYKAELTPRDERMTADEGDQFAKDSPETQSVNIKKQEFINEYEMRQYEHVLPKM